MWLLPGGNRAILAPVYMAMMFSLTSLLSLVAMTCVLYMKLEALPGAKQSLALRDLPAPPDRIAVEALPVALGAET